MRTLILLGIFVSTFTVRGQEVSLGSFSFFQQDFKQRVEIINRDDNSSVEVNEKGKILVACFENAIGLYLRIIKSDDQNTPLKKISSFSLGGRIPSEQLGNIQLTIVILDRKDELTDPEIISLPSLLGGKDNFLVRVPYMYIAKPGNEKRFEHLALHEIGHVVAGDGGETGLPKLEAEEKEKRVEYLVLKLVGREKYSKFMRNLFDENMSAEKRNSMEIAITLWINTLGGTDN